MLLDETTLPIRACDRSRARPNTPLVLQPPEHVVTSVLGVAGQDYAIYLADAREVTERRLEEPIEGELAVLLPDGHYQATFLSPVIGTMTEDPKFKGGDTRIRLPKFNHDLAIRLRRS